MNNGGCEAFVELQKALNVVGDYRLSSSVTSARWATPWSTAAGYTGDYINEIKEYETDSSVTTVAAAASAFCSTVGPACFCAAIDLETSNGVEISGLNAEEQSDISFIATWAKCSDGSGVDQNTTYTLTVFTYYDAMLILRENNVLELIQ